MFNIRDNVYANRWVTMTDGTVVKFENQMARVADQYMPYFRKISDFQIGAHFEDAVVAEPAVEVVAPVTNPETPAETPVTPEEAPVETTEPVVEQPKETFAEKIEEKVEEVKQEIAAVEKKVFNKILPEKKK